MLRQKELYLGIEGGGTRTVALLIDPSLAIVARGEFGPGNLRLLDDVALLGLFREIALVAPSPSAIGVGLAGLREIEDKNRVVRAVNRVWGDTPATVTNDLEIALAAAERTAGAQAEVLVLSGTGSCCFGRDRSAKTAKVGGWGHILGDIGSGYDIALRAIRLAIYEFDRHGTWGCLGVKLLRALALNSPDQLIAWSQSTEKRELARLAPVVFEAAAARDKSAQEVLREAASSLAKDAIICADRLAKRSQKVAFIAAGGILRKQPRFAGQVGKLIDAQWPSGKFSVLSSDGALGAAKLAKAIATALPPAVLRDRPAGAPLYVPGFDPHRSPTEMRNPKSVKLHRLSIAHSVSLLLEAEAEVIPALRAEQRAIEHAVQRAARALRRGGRLFYVGAGTSGRLGVLDASECPPTFRASPDQIQGIIAGGHTALWQAVEGAEDDGRAGAESIRMRSLGPRDVLVGIAASGRTPFVWGALAEARNRGADTILLTFNPALQIAREHRPDVVIAPNLGPEILTGSTRLKCGTATKLVLNMISTLSMVRLGKVISNLMIDLNPSNVKLRDRALRILVELTSCSRKRAAEALERNGWVVSAAWHELAHRKKAARQDS